MRPKPNPPQKDLRLITQDEAAIRLGLNRVGAKDPKQMIRRMARRGELVGVRVRRFLMIDPRSVDQYIEGSNKRPRGLS